MPSKQIYLIFLKKENYDTRHTHTKKKKKKSHHTHKVHVTKLVPFNGIKIMCVSPFYFLFLKIEYDTILLEAANKDFYIKSLYLFNLISYKIQYQTAKQCSIYMNV